MDKFGLGAIVKVNRELRTWTQEHLAEICDVSSRTIQRIEAGEVEASPETLMALAQAFDMDTAELRTLADPAAIEKAIDQWFEAEDIRLLRRIVTGHDLSRAVGGSHLYLFDQPPLEGQEEAELVGGFLEEMRDWGDIWSNIGPRGHADATISMTKSLHELDDRGFWVFGFSEDRKYCVGPNKEVQEWTILVLVVVRKDNALVIKRKDEHVLPSKVDLSRISLI